MASVDIEFDLVIPPPPKSPLPCSACTFETDFDSSFPMSSPSADPGWPTSGEDFMGKVESWGPAADTPPGKGSGRMSGE